MGPRSERRTRRLRIRFAGPRRRTRRRSPACSRRPSSGPSTASRPRATRDKSTASRRRRQAPRKSMNRAAAGRTRRSPRPAASRGSRSRRAGRVQQHAQIFENSHFCGVLLSYRSIRRWRRYDDDSCEARRVARAQLYSFGRQSGRGLCLQKKHLPNQDR